MQRCVSDSFLDATCEYEENRRKAIEETLEGTGCKFFIHGHAKDRMPVFTIEAPTNSSAAKARRRLKAAGYSYATWSIVPGWHITRVRGWH